MDEIFNSDSAQITPTSDDGSHLTVSLEHKLGLPDYSSATGFMSLQGLTASTTPEEMAALVEKGKVAYSLMGSAIVEKVKEAARGKGWSVS